MKGTQSQFGRELQIVDYYFDIGSIKGQLFAPVIIRLLYFCMNLSKITYKLHKENNLHIPTERKKKDDSDVVTTVNYGVAFISRVGLSLYVIMKRTL